MPDTRSLTRDLAAVVLVFGVAAGCLAQTGEATQAAEPAHTGDLFEAVQAEQVERVEKLLEEGADANARNRYGATALFFACDRGNVEIAELLLAHGAEVNVTDTFYQATPLGWALFNSADSEPHVRIAILLLKHGAEGAGMALRFGVQRQSRELVKAALATGQVEAKDVAAALGQAREEGAEELAALLESRLPEGEPAEGASAPGAPDEGEAAPKVELSPEQLAAFAGHFKDEEDNELTVVLADGSLAIQAAGQPPLGLEARGERSFEAPEAPGLRFSFGGEGDAVDQLVLTRGDEPSTYRRFDPEAAAKAAREAAAKLPPLPAAERQPARPWPRFRGPGGSGIGDGQGAPVTWDGPAGENVRWKTPVPGLGNSSPVVWGGKVFLTTAVSTEGDNSLRTGLYGDVDSVEDDSVHTWKVFALDLETGEILWQRDAAQGPPKEKRHLKSTLANPTPATDGEHLVVHFGSEGLFCYDLDGNLLWHEDQGKLSSGWFYDSSYEWGFASSPILHEGRAITQVDVHKGSFLAAYDLATGREEWRTSRDEIPTWGTPAILPGGAPGKAEIVTNGTRVRGYRAATGELLWSLAPNSEITVASPVVADGLTYVTGGYPPARPIYAVRPGGEGDLSLPEGETAGGPVVWSKPRGGTYMPTPLVYRGLLYVLHNNGRLAAYEAATGEEIYRERVGKAEGFSGSPVAADGRLLFTSEDGETHVVRAGRTFEPLGTNSLGEVVMSTPAISDGLVVIRAQGHVYGLGEPPPGDSEGTR